MTGAEVLALPMARNDAGAATIRDYLVAIVERVWDEGEGFSGKRPFGNSGWDWELYDALSKAGELPITHGEVDSGEGDRLIRSAIEALRTPTT